MVGRRMRRNETRQEETRWKNAGERGRGMVLIGGIFARQGGRGGPVACVQVYQSVIGLARSNLDKLTLCKGVPLFPEGNLVQHAYVRDEMIQPPP